MARTRYCDPAVVTGRLAKAIEFFGAAELLETTAANAAGDLFVDAGIAASDVICCVRLGEHASGENHNQAIALLDKADSGSGKHLSTLLGLKNKVAYTHHTLSGAECKKMNRAASHLVESARLAAASGRR
jgi:hypothetical protein